MTILKVEISSLLIRIFPFKYVTCMNLKWLHIFTFSSLQSTLKPKCGRLVGFNSGNYHGVKAVVKGQRCAVAMWYTLNEKYKEVAHSVAANLLAKMKDKQAPAKEEL
jgi:hypothetical protein